MKNRPNISFVVPGEPIPKGRPRVTKSGKTYTPRRTMLGEELVQSCFRQSYPGVSSLYQEFEVHLTFFRRSKRKTDLDNLAKLVLDALNGLIWDDDWQITKLVLEKVGVTTDPHALVEVWVRWQKN